MSIKAIPDVPALTFGKRERWVVVADLHLGIVDFPERSVVRSLSSILSKGFDGIVILGDVKHDIGMRNRERKEVELLISEIKRNGVDEDNIILVKGNHDGGIDDMIRTTPSSGLVIGEVGLFHGHAKPSEDVLSSKYVVFAHIHPAVLLKDAVGRIKRRVWLKGEWDRSKVIVMPAFNELCASIALNVERRILSKYRSLDEFQAVMIDGTPLGRIKDLVEQW